MNNIQSKRLKSLEEVTRRLKQNDYEDMPYGDIEEIVLLLKTIKEWNKDLKSGQILEFIKDPIERASMQVENERIEANNKRIREKYIEPLEIKIKILEIELILYHGVFNMPEIANDIYQRVYPKMEEIE